MIVNRETMIRIEQSSGLDTVTLMERAGAALAAAIDAETGNNSNILILCGKGNNGGDGLVAARYIKHGHVKVMLIDGTVKTDAAKLNLDLLPSDMFINKDDFEEAVSKADVIVDCVYGFSYHGRLKPEIAQMFRQINSMNNKVISADINSGCEADTGYADPDAIESDLTCALDCFKPFHMLKKDHHKFRECKVLSLSLPHPEPSIFKEMNEVIFFNSFARKEDNSYKNTFGQILLAGGGYGMAGALGLNITGARAAGASYIHVVLDNSIYPVLASRFLTPVYHPVKDHPEEVILPLLKHVRACAFGSGSVSFPDKEKALEEILKNADCPVVLDAEALHLLSFNKEYLKETHTDVILTPHIGEFSALTGLSASEINANKISHASSYARENHVIVVLKGSHTIAASPEGEIYINQSGCQALAQAGSGDVLAGMITAVLPHQKDVFKAVCMAVWLHGFLSESSQHNHSMQCFPLEDLPAISDTLFRKHGF